VSAFDQRVAGDPDGWSTTHSVVLTNLVVGTTYEYYIAAGDHVTNPLDSPNYAFYTNTFIVPPPPVLPPVILGLTVTNVSGNSATLIWRTDRPCTGQLSYLQTGIGYITQSLFKK
jgi:hypothetical protein